MRQGIPARQVLPPKGAPRTESDALAQTLWQSTRWCHVLVGLGRGADTLHAQVTGGTPAPDPLRRLPPPLPPPPPSLELGWKVPDHERRRRPKEILLHLVRGERVKTFPPHVSILKMLSFWRRTQQWMKTKM